MELSIQRYELGSGSGVDATTRHFGTEELSLADASIEFQFAGITRTQDLCSHRELSPSTPSFPLVVWHRDDEASRIEL